MNFITNSKTTLSELKDILKAQSRFVEDVKKKIIRFQEAFELFKQLNEKERKVLVSSGWFITPAVDTFPYPDFMNALSEHDKGNEKGMDDLFKSIFSENDWQFLEGVIEDWGKFEFFNQKRMSIIKDAFKAHKQGYYTLVVPALLPIVEGVAGDYCRKNKKGKSNSDSKGKLTTLIKDLGFTALDNRRKVILEYVEKILYEQSPRLRLKNKSKRLNRHEILHGDYYDYVDWQRSLRCFLLIDFLTYALNESAK